MKKRVFSMVFSVFLLMGILGAGTIPAGANTIDLDLTEFYLDGIGDISGSSSATLLEDPDFGYTLLVNDPSEGFGDPGIIVPSNALTLSFDYDFTEEDDNDTEFFVQLMDADTGDELDWFLRDVTGAGLVEFDLTQWIASGMGLFGLRIYLNEYNYTLDGQDIEVYNTGSEVTISNLKLTTTTTVIPEPGTILLLGFGLIALSRAQRKRS